MTSTYSEAALALEPEAFRRCYDREPLGFTHRLHELDLFQPDALATLAARFAGHRDDYFVAQSAPSPDTAFYQVPHGGFAPHEALEHLDKGAWRILLKRPERHDAGFRALLDALFAQVTTLRGGLGGERVVRLESAVFISSASSTTPFHFDPEVNFFSQIAGEKTYHVYSPSVVSEAELEAFYRRGEVDIAQVALAGRDAGQEHVFQLRPGLGFHQPQNAPHWVVTGPARSVSYSFVFETDASRKRGAARGANHYLRRLGLTPTLPGVRPELDARKAGTMRVVGPVHRGVRRMLRKTLGR